MSQDSYNSVAMAGVDSTLVFTAMVVMDVLSTVSSAHGAMHGGGFGREYTHHILHKFI